MRKCVFVNNCYYIAISFFLSLFYCWVTNGSFLSENIDYELFREVNGSIYGYSSLQSYFWIYMPIFFLFLMFLMKEERDYRTVRFKSRQVIAVDRIKVLGRAVGIILLPHFFVQILSNVVIFGGTSFLSGGYFFAEMLQAFNVAMVFAILGLCFGYAMLYMKKEASLFIMLIGTLIFYFGNRIFLHYVLLREMCVRDLIIGKNYQSYEFIFFAVKNMILFCVLARLTVMGLKETDLYEK